MKLEVIFSSGQEMIMRNSQKNSIGVLFFFFKDLFIYFWQHWVFVAACGLSLVAARGGYSSLLCTMLLEVAALVAEHGL